MLEIFTAFMISQVLMVFAMVTDFLWFQFKDRKKTVILLAVSCFLICAHYLLLDKFTAWIIVSLSAIRYIVSYFTTNKKVLLMFILLNSLVLILTFSELLDLIFFSWITISMIWNFQDQKHNKLMRILMMIWTSIVILYNTLIFSPMAILTEVLFLMSNFIWYFRFYIKWKK